MKRTLLHNGTVIYFENDEHVVRSNTDVLICGDRIENIGPSHHEYPSNTYDEIIDATDYIVMPGLVNTHIHVTDTAFTKGWLDDYATNNNASSKQNVTALYKLLPGIRNAVTAEDQLAAARCAFAELLLAGSTTAVELSYDAEMGDGGDLATVRRTAAAAGEIGIRCYIGPRYRDHYWQLGTDGRPVYFAYERAADRMYECFDFCTEINGQYDDRVRAILAPGQVDTCNHETLRATRKQADKTGFPIQLHAGQSPSEYRRIREQHQQTTLHFLDSTGLLGPDLILGHGMYFSESGDVNACTPDELKRLRTTGTHIAHLPWVKARQGVIMQSLAKYLQQGINVSLGTDTYPFDMFSEMKFAASMCRVADQSAASVSARDILRLATLGGARALNRQDLGKLASGCQADIILLEKNKPHAVPMIDPIKHIVFNAKAEDVNTVFVAGQKRVANHKVIDFDMASALQNLNDANQRVLNRIKFD